MSVLTYKRVQTATKIEATLGTAETHAATDVTDRWIDPKLRIVRPVIEVQRPERDGDENNVPADAHTEFTGKLHARGAGTAIAPGWASKLLPACGFKDNGDETFTISDATDDWKTLTVATIRDGKKRIGRGMMGTFEATWTAGKPLDLDFSLFGGFVSKPTEASNYADPTYNTNQPPIWAGTGAFTVGGSAAFKPSTCKLTLGGNPYPREDPNSAGGYISGWLQNRVPRFTMDPEAVAIATKDWPDLMDTAGTVDVVLLVGTTTGHKIQFTLNDLQPETYPDENDRDGKFVDGLGFTVNGDIVVAFL